MSQAVQKVRASGFALDAPLGNVQRPLHTEEPIALHGGDALMLEGVDTVALEQGHEAEVLVFDLAA